MADIFSESIEQHLKHKEAEKKAQTRVSMNDVAKQQQPIPVPAERNFGVTSRPAQEQPPQYEPMGAQGHNQSRVHIYCTKSYDRFVNMPGNRALNRAKINRIKKDIENGLDLLRYCPIIVAEKDGKLEVIDGQHRLQVCKDMRSLVWYVLADELTILEVARMNSNTEKGKNKDFIHCYTSQGNEHYKKVQEFMDKYKFRLSATLALLTKGSITNDGSNEHSLKKFQEGSFVVNKEAEAINVAETVLKFEGFSAVNSRTFVMAICKILEGQKIDIQEVIDAYLANKDKLQPQGNWKGYLMNLETIVNINKSKRRIIY